jgi:SAM-dependent methyltransferase
MRESRHATGGVTDAGVADSRGGAHGSTPRARRLRRGLSRIVRREWVDEAWDWLRLKVDAFGAADYQPLSLDPSDSAADRAAGTLSRWQAIEPLVEELRVRSAVDVGCNVGWFARNLAARGIPTVGVEAHPPLYRTAIYTARKSGAGRMGVLALQVTPETARLVPHADCTIFLAVWHHLVRRQGIAAADVVLGELWRATRTVLFFETGEDGEMPEYYELPAMTPEPRGWIHAHLEQMCPDGTVRHLGMHASSPTYSRNLFAVVRSADLTDVHAGAEP